MSDFVFNAYKLSGSRTSEKVARQPVRSPAVACQRQISTLPQGTRFTFTAVKESNTGRMARGLSGVIIGPGPEGGIEVFVRYTALDGMQREEWSGMTYVTPEAPADEATEAA